MASWRCLKIRQGPRLNCINFVQNQAGRPKKPQNWVRFRWTTAKYREMITGRTRIFLILPCDWRFLPKLAPRAAGAWGFLFLTACHTKVIPWSCIIFARLRLCCAKPLCSAANFHTNALGIATKCAVGANAVRIAPSRAPPSGKTPTPLGSGRHRVQDLHPCAYPAPSFPP
jgi:hypothetical protein